MDRFITVAIHTYEKAIALRALLEREGIEVQFRNVNIEHPVVSSGIRVRIRETDLPLALRIIENREIFSDPVVTGRQADPAMPILVPIDFSDVSRQAVHAAFHIAAAHGTSLILLHTYIDPYVAGSMQLTDSLTYEMADASSREKAQNAAKAQMRHFAARIKDAIKMGTLPPVKFEQCVMEGVPEDAINEFTKARNPFLIVMGTRNARQKEAEMIGSVTAEVLDKCRFTVLALPHEADTEPVPFQPRKLLFLCNIEQEDILAMDTLCRLFPKAMATVTIANVPGRKRRQLMRNTADAAQALQAYCQQNFKTYTFETANISLERMQEELDALETKKQYDLVVIPNKKKSIFSRLFNPSLAHQVLFAADIPMLVIPV